MTASNAGTKVSGPPCGTAGMCQPDQPSRRPEAWSRSENGTGDGARGLGRQSLCSTAVKQPVCRHPGYTSSPSGAAPWAAHSCCPTYAWVAPSARTWARDCSENSAQLPARHIAWTHRPPSSAPAGRHACRRWEQLNSFSNSRSRKGRDVPLPPLPLPEQVWSPCRSPTEEWDPSPLAKFIATSPASVCSNKFVLKRAPFSGQPRSGFACPLEPRWSSTASVAGCKGTPTPVARCWWSSTSPTLSTQSAEKQSSGQLTTISPVSRAGRRGAMEMPATFGLENRVSSLPAGCSKETRLGRCCSQQQFSRWLRKLASKLTWPSSTLTMAFWPGTLRRSPPHCRCFTSVRWPSDSNSTSRSVSSLLWAKRLLQPPSTISLHRFCLTNRAPTGSLATSLCWVRLSEMTRFVGHTQRQGPSWQARFWTTSLSSRTRKLGYGCWSQVGRRTVPRGRTQAQATQGQSTCCLLPLHAIEVQARERCKAPSHLAVEVLERGEVRGTTGRAPKAVHHPGNALPSCWVLLDFVFETVFF